MRFGIIAHLLSFEAGYRQAGVSRYIEHLLRELPVTAPGDDIVVFGNRAVEQTAASTMPPALSWRLSRLPTERRAVRIAWEQALAPLVAVRDAVDVVHAPVNIAPLLAPRPVVVTVHALAFLRDPEQYPAAQQQYLRLFTALSVRRARRIIAVSEHTRQDILRYYGVQPERVVTVPNGVDHERFRPVSDPQATRAFRAAHGLPEDFILFVGTLQPRKNLVGLLRAYAQLDPATRPPLIVGGGEGWLYEPIFTEAQALGVADDVRFAGYIDPVELPLWYSAATMFVYPSLYEGFGLPVLEAMACGSPVITSSTSALAEVAGDAALLVDPEDVGSLSAALRRLGEDAELRATLRRRGLERAAAFSWERTARATVQVYRAAYRPARAAR